MPLYTYQCLTIPEGSHRESKVVVRRSVETSSFASETLTWVPRRRGGWTGDRHRAGPEDLNEEQEGRRSDQIPVQ